MEANFIWNENWENFFIARNILARYDENRISLPVIGLE